MSGKMKTFGDPTSTKRFYESSQQTLTNLEVRGQGKDLKGLHLLLWRCVFELQSIASRMSAPLSPLLSQRKGILRGPEASVSP